MQIDVVDWFKFNYLTILYLIIISTRIILTSDTTETVTLDPSRQICSKIQSMLRYGKYQTYQMSSNITYVSRTYAQNFLAYSPLDDLLIFIEPKHQLHVYNTQTVRLIVNLTTTNIVYATSCISLLTNNRYELFFVYETRLESNLVSIRVCQMYFNIFKLNFEEKKCIQRLIIRCDTSDIRVNGFTIKRDHAGTNNSLLFISTNIGLICAIFNTNNGSLIREPIVLNDTLNEGSIVTTSSGIIYYANKQEHTIHEIHITRDFRVRYGKIIKSNAIKSPFGLITDECNHLYISTKSMILIMFIDTYTTIRSVFSKASDLPITIERLNSTTYVYATVKIYSGRISPIWMFNFLSFADIEKPTTSTRPPGRKKIIVYVFSYFLYCLARIPALFITKLPLSSIVIKKIGTTNMPTSSSISESLSLMTTTHFSSTSQMFEQTTSIDRTALHSLLKKQSTSVSPNEFQKSTKDNTSPPNDIYLTTLPTISNVILNNAHTSVETVSDDYTTSTGKITISTSVSDEYSQFSTSTFLFSSITQPTTQISEEKSTFSSSLSTEYSTEYLHSSLSTSTSLETNLMTSPFDVTLSSHAMSTIKKQTIITELNTVRSLSTDVESTSLDTTSEYLSDISNPHFSPPLDQSASQINDVIISTIPFETTSLQNQLHSSTIESSDNNVIDDPYNEFPMTTDLLISNMQTSTLSMTTTDFIDKEIEDGINQKHSSPMLVDVNVSSTLHSLSPFDVSSTVLIPSRSSQLSSSSLHPSLTDSSTTLKKLNRLLSSKYFSVATTTMSNPSTMLSSSISTLQTTDSAITSDITEQNSMTTFSDESSSPLITSYPDDTSLLTYALSSKSSTIDYATLSTTIVTSTILDSTTTVQTDESSTLLLTTIATSVSSITDEYSSKYASTQSSLEIVSTIFPDVYDSTTVQPTLVVTQPKSRSNRPSRRTSESTTSSTTTSTTTTTTEPYRTRKPKVTRLKSSSSSSTTTTSTTAAPETSLYSQLVTSSIFVQHLKLNSLEQHQMVVIKPSLNTNSSNTLLSNELLNTLFNSTTNSSEKYIFVNLNDLPPSTWNLSLRTNESILLDIALPAPTFPLNLNTTTNLTFINVEANRFSTNIIGSPVNLQVDQIRVKQFSLAMNLTNDQSNQSLSDVVIGHVKSEKFELNITKSDNMNIHIQQVDSETAELFFDSQFCTNESNLQINLNLSKNGTIRYGNRTPIRIGPVFTRVHMLKQSCDLDQPFTLFFDICQGQNPCLNGGTCKSQIPNYDDPSYSHKESSQINYQCICPVRIFGEHCEHSQYPLGYCFNGGSLISTFDNIKNKSIEQCLCVQGFQGHHCENNIDDCINIDCSKHGICQDGINTYTCSCFDGFYGDQCQEKNVETILLQVASKSFATVAILLIASIVGLVVASDIHTYVTRKKQKSFYELTKLPRATSEIFENSVLLLGFGDAPIEMSDLSTINGERKTITTTTMKQRPKKIRKQSTYKQISERRYARTLERPPSKRSLLSNRSYETIL